MANPQLEDVQEVELNILINDYDADGNLIGPSTEKGTITVTPDDLTKITFVPDPTPAAGQTYSGLLKGGKTLGTVNITIAGLKADGVTPWFAPIVDSIDIINGPASQSVAAVSLGTPQPQ